jgi:Putative restriction endonuclease
MSTRTLPGGSPRLRPVPPLQNGDRLDADEFMRRYQAMPEDVKAELIEGVVYMASPVTVFQGNPHADVVGWLHVYRVFTPGTDVAVDTTVRLDKKSVPQPDAALYILPEFGGQVRISEDGYVSGPAELAIEISTSSVSYDLGPKLTGYARNGIREYVVWRTEDQAIDWFVLRNGSYEPLAAADGACRSEGFPGLWLDVDAMVRRDVIRVNAVLQQGLQSPEHARFVAELAARRTS